MNADLYALEVDIISLLSCNSEDAAISRKYINREIY